MSNQDSQTCILKVSMHCVGCEKKVKKILHKIDGVNSVNIKGGEKGKVVVTGNVNPATLIKTLKMSGNPAKIWDDQRGTQLQNMQVDHGKRVKYNKSRNQMSQKVGCDGGQSAHFQNVNGPHDFKVPTKQPKSVKFNLSDKEFDDYNKGGGHDQHDGHGPSMHNNTMMSNMMTAMGNGNGPDMNNMMSVMWNGHGPHKHMVNGPDMNNMMPMMVNGHGVGPLGHMINGSGMNSVMSVMGNDNEFVLHRHMVKGLDMNSLMPMMRNDHGPHGHMVNEHNMNDIMPMMGNGHELVPYGHIVNGFGMNNVMPVMGNDHGPYGCMVNGSNMNNIMWMMGNDHGPHERMVNGPNVNNIMQMMGNDHELLSHGRMINGFGTNNVMPVMGNGHGPHGCIVNGLDMNNMMLVTGNGYGSHGSSGMVNGSDMNNNTSYNGRGVNYYGNGKKVDVNVVAAQMNDKSTCEGEDFNEVKSDEKKGKKSNVDLGKNKKEVGLVGRFMGFDNKNNKKEAVGDTNKKNINGEGDGKISGNDLDYFDFDIPTHAKMGKGRKKGNNHNGNAGRMGPMKQNGPMGQMDPMGNMANVQAMNNGGEYYQGRQQMQPSPSNIQQQHQCMGVMMNQQQQANMNMYPPSMMQDRPQPQPSMNYMPLPPLSSYPMPDPITHIFSDENVQGCSIM
ncbi:hypothetical protein RIF29_24423 [Crotalaria pallida]|uniref:HMA domain-containing protein n=1 Tax=Crotalaria pallida TaxID=3830 RepID=A0AAN9I058_CROPI